jgi:hypothetical protein
VLLSGDNAVQGFLISIYWDGSTQYVTVETPEGFVASTDDGSPFVGTNTELYYSGSGCSGTTYATVRGLVPGFARHNPEGFFYAVTGDLVPTVTSMSYRGGNSSNCTNNVVERTNVYEVLPNDQDLTGWPLASGPYRVGFQ